MARRARGAKRSGAKRSSAKYSRAKRSGVQHSSRVPRRRHPQVGLHSLREFVRTLHLCSLRWPSGS
jgi:hypothetical protein